VPSDPPDLASDLDLALRLADAADEVSMSHFTGEPVATEAKADGSPVTLADPAVERRVAELVAAERPGDVVLGEEVGTIPPANGTGGPTRRWIVDGIDGTVLFADGAAEWATQIALEVDGEVVVGVSTSPAVGARWWASHGAGAWRARIGGTAAPVRLAVSAATTDARVTVIPPRGALTGALRALADRLAVAADYVDPTIHGALLVAEGAIEACLQPAGGPWDFAALALVVEEAGGRFGTLARTRDIHAGGPVLYTNATSYDPLVAALTIA
jgi:histidinol-phosphatase